MKTVKARVGVMSCAAAAALVCCAVGIPAAVFMGQSAAHLSPAATHPVPSPTSSPREMVANVKDPWVPEKKSVSTPGPETLPEGLIEAIRRDLHISADEYLARAAAAADASAMLPKLAQIGVPQNSIWLDGATIQVHTDSAAQASSVHALGAHSTTQEPPSPRKSATASAFSNLDNGTNWQYPVSLTTGYDCTVGFNGYSASGASEFATAGHCYVGLTNTLPVAAAYALGQSLPNQTPTSATYIGPLATNTFQFGNGFDSGLIPVTSSSLTPTPNTSLWDGNNGTTPVRGTITAVVGDNLCKSGATTGWTCGRVTGVNVPINVSTGGSSTVTVNSDTTTMCMYHGDSGGPAMVGMYAVGINSSGTWSSVGCTDTNGQSNIFPFQGASGHDVSSQNPGWEPAVVVDTPAVTSISPAGTTSFSGTLANRAVGDKVAISIDGGTTPTTVNVNPDGTWNLNVAGLAPGSHTYRAIGSWGTYSKSSSSAVGSFTVPIPVTITAPASGSTVATQTPTLSGTGTPGATVTISISGGASLGATTVGPDGNWSFTVPTNAPLTNGARYTLAATQDVVGAGTTTATGTFTIQAPLPLEVTSPADDSITNATPTISGTGVPGTTINITDRAGSFVGSAVVASSGAWTFTPSSALPLGREVLTITDGVNAPLTLTLTVADVLPAPIIEPFGLGLALLISSAIIAGVWTGRRTVRIPNLRA